MKTTLQYCMAAIVCAMLAAPALLAQDYSRPLTFQGLTQTAGTSAASRGTGGITIAVRNDIGSMFANPASLQSIDGFKISVEAYRQYRSLDQTQMWFPSLNYPNFSLLLGGLTDTLTLPVIDSATYAKYFAVSTNNPSGADTIFRQYDNLRPNWQQDKNKTQPVQIFAAVPFSLGDMRIAAGVGCIEYADMNYFYQNNNVLTPDPGKLYPQPFLRPTTDDNAAAVPVWWSQSQRMRDGSIYGYGGALSASAGSHFSFGLSGMSLAGRTTDDELVAGRGILSMHRTFFSMGKDIYASSQHGNSDFTGQEFTGSALYEGEFLTLGFSVKPPTTITRDYTGTLVVHQRDSSVVSSSVKTSDKIKLPWRGVIGAGVAFRRDMSLKLEYEYLPLASALFSRSDSSANPWLDGFKLKVGFEYVPSNWLTLRCGYNRHAEVFAAQNYYFPSDPLTTESYAAGVGVRFGDARADLAYEYVKVSYEDMWTTNANVNSDIRQSIVLSVTYVIN